MTEFYVDSHPKYNKIGNVRITVILKRNRVTPNGKEYYKF